MIGAGGQYPRTGVARHYGLWARARRPHVGREKPSAERQTTALSRKETRDHEHRRDTVRYPYPYRAAHRGPVLAAGRGRWGDRRGAPHLFVVLAVGMNLIGYWFADKIATAGRLVRQRPSG